MVTYTARCQHGELWAVCRQCSTADPLYVADEEPWLLEELARENRQRSGRIAAVALLALVAIAFIAWRTA